MKINPREMYIEDLVVSVRENLEYDEELQKYEFTDDEVEVLLREEFGAILYEVLTRI